MPKAQSVEDSAGQAPEAKPHPKRRPMSAVFSEYPQPPKPGPGGVTVTGKVPPTPPEKTWVVKPRPFSVDLTAGFESREVLLRKVAPEQNAAERQGPERRTSLEPRRDAEGPALVEASPQDPDSDFQEVTKRLHARREKILLKYIETDSPRTPRTRATPGGDRSPQEEEPRLDQKSEKVQECPLPRPGRDPGLAEVKGGRVDQEASAGMERASVGSVRKRLSVFEEDSAAALAAASDNPTPMTPEPPSTVSEPERVGVNVQARIRGWTVESSGEKPEVRRKASQARPLSADLTRV